MVGPELGARRGPAGRAPINSAGALEKKNGENKKNGEGAGGGSAKGSGGPH